MTQIIRVPVAEVRRVAGEFRSAGTNSQDIITRIQGQVSNLQGQWEGMTQQRFYGDFETWKSAMTNYIDLLNNIARELDAIATRFEATDQSR